jgi:hypothetical protein
VSKSVQNSKEVRLERARANALTVPADLLDRAGVSAATAVLLVRLQVDAALACRRAIAGATGLAREAAGRVGVGVAVVGREDAECRAAPAAAAFVHARVELRPGKMLLAGDQAARLQLLAVA